MSTPLHSLNSPANKNIDSTGFTAIIVVLDMLTIQLEDIAKDVEVSVTGVCGGFQGMSNRARNALSAAANALESSTDGGGIQAFVHRVGMALEIMLHRIESSSDFSAQLSNEIEDVCDRLHVINDLDEKLSKICDLAKQANKEGNAGLHSPGDCRDSLASLVEATSVLTSVIGATSSSISRISSGLSSSVRRLSARIKCKAEEDQEAIRSSEQTVRETLDKLSLSYDKMTKSLSNSAVMSRQLNMDIGQAVMSMQFQDRVNQRIQHLVETVSELGGELQQFTKFADKDRVKTISDYWMERVAEKSTMKAERISLDTAVTSNSDVDSVELF